jgi:chromosome segregation ATPase
VNEEQLTSESIGVINADLNMLLLYSRHRAISPKIKEALEKIVAMRNTLSDLERRGGQLNQQINDITQEQSRIRENMKVLPQNSELYSRYLKKFDEQETQIEGLREQLRKLRVEEETQRKQLDDYVSNLQLD